MTKTALITGASGGIGLELARLFARNGYRLILVSRDLGRLQQAAQQIGGEPVLIASDLSIPGAATEVFNEVALRGITVDALVNNAGFGVFGLFAETRYEDEIGMLELNIVSLAALTKLLLPGMIERRFGRILNVASIAAFQLGPLMAGYFASKAYVVSFSHALANETQGTGVSVTVLCPGPVKTGFQERSGMPISKTLSAMTVSASAVAEAGYRGLMSGKCVVIPGFGNRVLALIGKITPDRISAAIVRKMQEKR